MNTTKGSSRINIGLIDGPVAINHPDLNTKNIIQIKGKQSGTCSVTDSIACNHGTFIAGILKANRGICPTTLSLRPIFSEHTIKSDSIPFTTPNELAVAILDCIDAGATYNNLTLNNKGTYDGNTHKDHCGSGCWGSEPDCGSGVQ